MNQLTHHILQEQTKQPTNLQTPRYIVFGCVICYARNFFRSDDFAAAPDFNQNSSNNNNMNSEELKPNPNLSHQNKSHSKVLQKVNF